MLLTRNFGIVSTAWLITFASPAAGAAHQVGSTFFDNDKQETGSDSFFLATTDATPKVAGIIGDIYMDLAQPAHRLLIAFDSKAEWTKFVGLWTEAVRSPLPSEADAYKINEHRDSYFDAGSEVDLTVSKDTDGGIDFAFAGEPDSTHEHPTVVGIVHLPQSDIKKFDQDVAVISAYFDAN